MSSVPSEQPWDWPLPHVTGDKEREYLALALVENDWSHTSFCEAFEREFAKFLGVRHAMLVPSGTSAVYLALVAAGIENGQEVIVPGITWPSVVYAILQAGGVPRVVDIARDSMCITTEAIDAAITERTFGVLATHIFGSQCDMVELCALANKRGIIVIEDAAQSVGSAQAGKSCGTWGLVGAFSLNDRKVLACGEGGCVVTDSDAVNDELRRLQLILPERNSTPASVPGTFKVSEFQAAVALAQLERLPTKLRSMENGAKILTQLLTAAAPRLAKQAQPNNVSVQSYFNYCISLRDVRLEMFAGLVSERIALRVARSYPPLAKVTDFLPLRSNRKIVSGGLFDELTNCEFVYSAGCVRLPFRVLLADPNKIERLGSILIEASVQAGG